MQKPVLVSVQVSVVSTVPPKVAWSFELYLYLELTVPQMSDCCPLGRLVTYFDQDLHCLPFRLHLLDSLLYGRDALFKF